MVEEVTLSQESRPQIRYSTCQILRQKSLSHSSVGHITQRDLGVETFKRSRVIVARRYVLIFRKEQKLLSSAAYVAGISDMIKLQTAFFSVINSRKCRQ